MKKKYISRLRKTPQVSEGGGNVPLTEVRQKYSRIYKERVAPRKTPPVPTPESIKANRELFEELSHLRKEATTKGLGGKRPDGC